MHAGGVRRHAQDADAPHDFGIPSMLGSQECFNALAQRQKLGFEQTRLHPAEKLAHDQQSMEFRGVEPKARQFVDFTLVFCVSVTAAFLARGFYGRTEKIPHFVHDAPDRRDGAFAERFPQTRGRDRPVRLTQQAMCVVNLFKPVHVDPAPRSQAHYSLPDCTVSSSAYLP